MAGINYRLYLVTDRSILKGRDFITSIRAAVKGGVTLVQLREKNLSGRDFYRLALAVKAELDQWDIPLIINDRVDVALAVDAAGVHVGQKDLPLPVVRDLVGKQKLVGLSVTTLEQAREGDKMGADYLGVGPVFYTDSKEDIEAPIGLEGLARIRQAVNQPLIAIGGISRENLNAVKAVGVQGVAVISAILGEKDIEKAAQRMSGP